jgi:hypothetical protein
MSENFRPPAVPLVTVDPYFNVWSMNDRLYDNHTKHWTAQRHDNHERHGMLGLAMIDGQVWRFVGKVNYDEDHYAEPQAMTQTSLMVKPLSSVYTFEGGGVTIKVSFTTPLLLDRLDILSRPVSYVTFDVVSIDGQKHDVNIYFDVTGEWCVHTHVQEIEWSRGTLGNDIQVMRMGTTKQAVLKRKGDNVRIDWGHFYLVVPDAGREDTVISSVGARKQFVKDGKWISEDDLNMPRPVEENTPVMAAFLRYGEVDGTVRSRHVLLAYDDIHSVEYFGKSLPGYWKKFHSTVDDMLYDAVREYGDIMRKCSQFDKQLMEDALQSGGPKYADMLSLAYRQAIAAHKLVEDTDGNILFFSKECNSNGCMGTVDVSYPSVPLFLLYNHELVEGMLRPIFQYANSEQWPYDFAPHDVGRYPIANGQIYGMELERQMPVEECGNMLIMTAAVCRMEGKAAFAAEHLPLLHKWANYLVEHGLDPGNQLCTDDFAGHLAHNANLSIKAIVGIGCYGLLCGMLGEEAEQQKYTNIARDMAQAWERMADDGDHYRLTFDRPGSWSLKYNLIWDLLLNLNLFPDHIRQKEVDYYISQKNRYGTPLDSRKTYTKSDWLVWAASLAESKADFVTLIEPLWSFLHETRRSRVPFSDWYYTIDGDHVAFINRSVIGGVFIKLLKDRW